MNPSWTARQKKFALSARTALCLLALVLGFLWFVPGRAALSPDETVLWRRVRAAQGHLHSWRGESGLVPAPSEDPWKTGFTGVEWSPVTTTLGPIGAKRTAADPLWAVYTLRQLRGMGLKKGDRVAVCSSSSFPGLVWSILAALEHLDIDVLWIHSLGSSTWGANVPGILWPAFEASLRKGGFLKRKADWYTLGGRAEMGLDLPPEGRSLLLEAARESGVPVLEAESLAVMIDRKAALLENFLPRLVILVGGSAANFGGGETEAPEGGIYVPGKSLEKEFPSGIFSRALQAGIPVMHFLNLRSLGRLAGIPYDGRPVPRFRTPGGAALPLLGLCIFLGFLAFFHRWGTAS